MIRTSIYVFINVLILQCATPLMAWMLSQLGLNETYRVRHISMHYERVFLSIEVENNAFPTLIESGWPDGYTPFRSSVFPNAAAHDFSIKTSHHNCRHIQRSIWTQVDSLNRLWVMDIGWKPQNENENENNTATPICYPKLLVYDLLRNNAEVLRIDCAQYIRPMITDLLTIKLGPPPGGSRSRSRSRCRRTVEKYVYFLRPNNPYILAYDIIEQRWHKRLLISQKFEQMLPEMLPIKPYDMAFGPNNVLLISDVDGELYRTTNALLRRHDKSDQKLVEDNAITKIDMSTVDLMVDKSAVDSEDLRGYLILEHLGSLLGPSRGMMVDYMNVLYYVVPKFGAVVRCPYYSKNLTAEGNEIIYMTSKNIQQIFFGSEDSVWLVTDRELRPHDHCFAGISS